MQSGLSWLSLVVFFCAFYAPPSAAPEKDAADSPVIRCAVIGGMTDTGLWDAVAERFTKATGIRTEMVVTGPKHVIAPVFRRGEADLITMHSSDTMINIVADGLAVDPQPWARNDLLIVGPADDPAGIKGERDAVKALAKIIESEAKFVVHPSLGANEVLQDLLAEGELALDPSRTVMMAADRNRWILKRVTDEKAYTLVGRIPFLNGKIAHDGLELMVEGDPRMRRPYLVAAAPGQAPRQAAARRLAAYLRSPETQAWIAGFGVGDLDDRPLFFPITLPADESQRPE